MRPAADTLAAGGKRVRPLLVFCSAPRPALEDPAALEHLLSAASAVELVHMATLVHDDLLDGATMRRGRPTVAQALGAERAVSTGDFLFARAFAELTRTRSAEAVQALAGAALALSQGEMDQQRAAFDLTLTEDAYLARCRRKTAALFSVACRLGALMGGAAAGRPRAWPRSARTSAWPSRSSTTSSTWPAPRRSPASAAGTDLCDGTVTLPVIIALQLEPGLRPARRRGLRGAGPGAPLRPPRRPPGARDRARAGARLRGGRAGRHP